MCTSFFRCTLNNVKLNQRWPLTKCKLPALIHCMPAQETKEQMRMRVKINGNQHCITGTCQSMLSKSHHPSQSSSARLMSDPRAWRTSLHWKEIGTRVMNHLVAGFISISCCRSPGISAMSLSLSRPLIRYGRPFHAIPVAQKETVIVRTCDKRRGDSLLTSLCVRVRVSGCLSQSAGSSGCCSAVAKTATPINCFLVTNVASEHLHTFV